MTDVFDQPQLLQAALRSHYTGEQHLLIAIEGHSSAGKSTLCTTLSRLAGSPSFGTDSYSRQRGSADNYCDLVDAERFAVDVRSAIENFWITFVEGICLRDVMDQGRMIPDLTVYCKRISAMGLWNDDPTYNVERGKPRMGLSWVDSQSVLYHLKSLPLKRSDYVFVWREE
jgi:hypothetical protein